MRRPPVPPDFDRPWPLAEVADYLGVSTKTLDRGRKAGHVRVIKVGTRCLVPGDEVRRLAAEGLKTGGGDDGAR